MGIAPFNFSTLKITGAPTYTGPKTIGTGRANDPHTYIFGSEFAATAGQQYVIFIVRTDGTPTTTLRINQSAVTQVAPSIRLVQGVAVSLASQAPTTSDTWTNTTTTVYGVGAIYRIT
jgi:hypothetical protein